MLLWGSKGTVKNLSGMLRLWQSGVASIWRVSFTSTVACSMLMEHPVNCEGSELAPDTFAEMTCQGRSRTKSFRVSSKLHVYISHVN